MNEVILYHKPNCHLCDLALEEIELAREQIEFELRRVNILTDLALYERYKHEIPVVWVNGTERFRHRLSARDLVNCLQQAG